MKMHSDQWFNYFLGYVVRHTTGRKQLSKSTQTEDSFLQLLVIILKIVYNNLVW